MNLVAKLKNTINRERGIPRFKLRLILVLLHTVFLIGLTIALQYTSLVRYDEISFLKSVAVWKHNVFKSDPKPLADSVVFIDVSKDLDLTDDSEYGPPDTTMKGARYLITDRIKLAKLFAIVNQHPNQYKYILCDLTFQFPGPGDSLLKPQIEKIKRILTSATFEHDRLIEPIFHVQSAMVSYTSVDDYLFTKLPVYNTDSLKTMPVVLYEKVTRNKFTNWHGMVMLNGKPAFSNILTDFYIRKNDLVRTEDARPVNTHYLGELLSDPDCFNVLRNKYIVIGAFTRDVHTTYAGNLPGSLILWDTYLTLLSSKTTISIGWLLMLFILYIGISYWIIIHPDKKFKHLHNNIKTPFVSKLIIKYISFIGIVIVIDIFSYFYFDTFISVFYIATYLTSIQVGLDTFAEWKEDYKRVYDWLIKKI